MTISGCRWCGTYTTFAYCSLDHAIEDGAVESGGLRRRAFNYGPTRIRNDDLYEALKKQRLPQDDAEMDKADLQRKLDAEG